MAKIPAGYRKGDRHAANLAGTIKRRSYVLEASVLKAFTQ